MGFGAGMGLGYGAYGAMKGAALGAVLGGVGRAVRSAYQRRSRPTRMRFGPKGRGYGRRRPPRRRMMNRRKVRRNLRAKARLADPHRLNPARVHYRSTAILNVLIQSITANFQTSSGVSGFTEQIVLNDYNTPWKGLTVLGAQPFGHDDHALKYDAVQVVGVTMDVLIRPLIKDAQGGTIFWRTTDESGVEDYTTHGSHGVGGVAGAPTQGGGFAHLIKTCPRYRWRQVKPTFNSEMGPQQTMRIRHRWSPARTNLIYNREDWIQALDGLDASAPPETAYFNIGYISDDNDATQKFEITYKKTYSISLGNRKACATID